MSSGLINGELIYLLHLGYGQITRRTDKLHVDTKYPIGILPLVDAPPIV